MEMYENETMVTRGGVNVFHHLPVCYEKRVVKMTVCEGRAFFISSSLLISFIGK